ncbi:MAG: phosphotransferase family protein [Acidimicrobiia bacterium]
MADLTELEAGLADALAPVVGTPVTIAGLRKLSGGASRETWSFAANGEEFILRRDPPGRPSEPGRVQLEVDVMRACNEAGLRAPAVVADDDGTRFGTKGLVMRRNAGDPSPRKILSAPEFAPAREVLPRQLAEFLAGLHALPLDAVPTAEEREPLEVWEKYLELGERRPVLEAAYAWLQEHRPAPRNDVVVHGDFRVGNLMVEPTGLSAVIDWEVAHRGDPMEDIAWFCLRMWRFGEPLEAGGLASLDDFLTLYEAAGGEPADRESLRWWLGAKTLVWAVGCMVQGRMHLSGRVRSTDLAAVGRRVTEQEWDLIELIKPEAAAAARTAPAPETIADDATPYGHPTARELLEAVEEFLRDTVAKVDDRNVNYHAKVSANILAQVQRELAHPAPERPADESWEALAHLTRDRLLVVNPDYL